MKKGLMIVLILTACAVFMGTSGQDEKQGVPYTGAEACKKCHGQENLGNQSIIWEESAHARAYTILTDSSIVENAKKRGAEVLPAENPKCLVCHAPLFEKAPEFMKEGITCEVCHAPEKNHKQEDIEFRCLPCHENAHGREFDMESAWQKIEHSLPKKEEQP